jgi:hypothetical protein
MKKLFAICVLSVFLLQSCDNTKEIFVAPPKLEQLKPDNGKTDRMPIGKKFFGGAKGLNDFCIRNPTNKTYCSKRKAKK